MTVSWDYIVITGGSSQGIGEPFASALLVRAPWPDLSWVHLDTTGWAAGGDLWFQELLPRFMRALVLPETLARNSAELGLQIAQGTWLPMYPSQKGRTGLGSALQGLSLAFAELELSEWSRAVLGFALALLCKFDPFAQGF